MTLTTATDTETGPGVVVENRKLALKETTTSISSPNDILVKIDHSAQNPVDVKMFDSGLPDGHKLGLDFSGVVYDIGDGVKNRELVGKRIAGVVKKGCGSFSDWTLASDGFYFDVPSNVRPDEASTLGVGCITAVLGLFLKLGLGFIDEEAAITEEKKDAKRTGACRGSAPIILVWGGNTSVGRYAIQMASLAGYDVITTSSMSPAKELRSLGAKRTYFYQEADVLSQIRDENGEIELVFDCIGSSETEKQCIQAAGEGETKYTTVKASCAGEGFPKNVSVFPINAFDIYNVSSPDAETCKEYAPKIGEWLQEGKLVPNVTLILGGLDQVAEGFDLYRDGILTGQKLVYENERTRKSKIGKVLGEVVEL
ncbi:Protein TOXD [Yarrowia sp. B02]|nr:Protein TOXD [Yarrowia sp. B02]